jgi:hypothetical protein
MGKRRGDDSRGWIAGLMYLPLRWDRAYVNARAVYGILRAVRLAKLIGWRGWESLHLLASPFGATTSRRED